VRIGSNRQRKAHVAARQVKSRGGTSPYRRRPRKEMRQKRPRTNYRAQQSISKGAHQERLLSAQAPCAEDQERWSQKTRGRETPRGRRTPGLALASGVGLGGAEALCGMVPVASVPWPLEPLEPLDPRLPFCINAHQWIGRKPPPAGAAAAAALCDQIHEGCVSGDGHGAEHRPQAWYRSRSTGLAHTCDR